MHRPSLHISNCQRQPFAATGLVGGGGGQVGPHLSSDQTAGLARPACTSCTQPSKPKPCLSVAAVAINLLHGSASEPQGCTAVEGNEIRVALNTLQPAKTSSHTAMSAILACQRHADCLQHSGVQPAVFYKWVLWWAGIVFCFVSEVSFALAQVCPLPSLQAMLSCGREARLTR